MENASKALIIAGAILLAILLISVGIIVIRAIDPVNQQAKDSAETMAIESYNAQFIKYEGEKVNGSTVKSLINTVRSSKAVHEREVEITYGGELTSEKDITPNGDYDVEITKWEDGYVKAMTISGKKIVKPTITPPAGEDTGEDTKPETPSNNPPTIDPEAIAEITTAKIKANGKDSIGDALKYTYTLLNDEGEKIEGAGRESGKTESNEWTFKELEPSTTYKCKVTVTDNKITTPVEETIEFTTKANNPPELKAEVTNITTTTATIIATGTDNDKEDKLTYNFYILNVSGKEKKGTANATWDVAGLEPKTTYDYKVEVTDGYKTTGVTGKFTTKEEIPANNPPELKAEVTDITTTTATIIATGTDKDGDTLKYTLEINEKTYGPSTTRQWTETGLKPTTTYDYKVTVTDEKGGTDIVKGEFTTLKENTAPTVTATVSNVREETATITANGSDADGDSLTYTFLLNGTEKQTGASSTCSLTRLTEDTTYNYEVLITDGKATNSYTRTIYNRYSNYRSS